MDAGGLLERPIRRRNSGRGAPGQATHPEATAVNAATPLIQSHSLGTKISRGTAPYWVGFRFVIGSKAVTITELARLMVAGNSQTHTLKLVDGSTGMDVPGGSVDLSMSGGIAGQYKYAKLSTPVTLAGNKTYYLVSWEVEGQDSFYDKNAVVTPGAVATILSGVYRINSNPWGFMGSTNNSWGPLNFKYTTSPNPVPLPLPVISSFTASPTSVKVGETAVLSWSVSGASSLSIDQKVGTVTGLFSKTVSPGQTTTYTLTATNAAGSTTKSFSLL